MKSYKRLGCRWLKLPMLFSICMVFLVLSACNDTQEGHKHPVTHMERIDPTCVSEGQIEYWKCEQCNLCFSDASAENEIEMKDTILPKTNHTIVDDLAVAATCENTGLTIGKHCSFCNQVFQEQESIPATGHQYDFENATWLWNEFQEATLRVPCKNDATHHQDYAASITSTTTKASCTSVGNTIYTASIEVNETVYTDQKEDVILPLEHDFDFDGMVWFWDGMNKASAQIPCKLDSTHALNFNAAIHVDTIEATCTTPGKITTTATIIVQGKTYQDQKEEVLPATGHSYAYDQLEWEWQGYASAKATVTCANDATHQITYDAAITTDSISATCTENGKTTYTASITVDGHTYTDKKEEIVYATGHDYDYTEPVWEWEGYKEATLHFVCKNEAAHLEYYNATIKQTTLPSTCVTEGSTTYAVSIFTHNVEYTDKKIEVLPINPDNHEMDYENIIWDWTPIVDGYEVKASVDCKCGVEHKTEEAIVEVDITPATFEQPGVAEYVAYVFEDYIDLKVVNLPIKQMVYTEEDFLEVVQSDAYDITLGDNIVLTLDEAILNEDDQLILDGYYAAIDLNGYTLTLPNYSMRIITTHAVVRNGYLITDLDNYVGSYVIATGEKSNILIENLTTFGGINIWDANAVIRNCDVTATFYYAVCAQGEAKVIVESGIYRKNFVSGCANTFFWVEKEGVDPQDGPYQSSELILANGLELYTATSATLYNTGGVAPVYEETPEIIEITPKEYLASDLEFKCLSLRADLAYTLEDAAPVLSGRKVLLDLEGHTFTVPEGILRLTAPLSRIRNGYLTLDDETSDYVLSIENEAEVLLDNLIITGGLQIQNSKVTIKNVTLNATNSYAVHSSMEAEVSLIFDATLKFLFQPKLTSTQVTKNTAGSNNAFYYVEEGSLISYLDTIEHTTTTTAVLYDSNGIAPIEAEST